MKEYLFRKKTSEEEIEDFEKSRKALEYKKAKKKIKELLDGELPIEDSEIQEIFEKDPLKIKEIYGEVKSEHIEDIENIIKNASPNKAEEIKHCVKKPNIEDVENINIIIKETIELEDNIREDIALVQKKKEIQKQISKDSSVVFDFEADEKEKYEEIKLKKDKIIENMEKLNNTLTLGKKKIKNLREYLETIEEEDLKNGIGLRTKKEIKRLEDEIWRIDKVIYLFNDESFQYISGVENY